MHESKQAVGVILHFHIDVEFDVLVLGLFASTAIKNPHQLHDQTGVRRTFINNATVSTNVGMDCLGSFNVLTCCMPSSPYQVRSLI